MTHDDPDDYELPDPADADAHARYVAEMRAAALDAAIRQRAAEGDQWGRTAPPPDPDEIPW